MIPDQDARGERRLDDDAFDEDESSSIVRAYMVTGFRTRSEIPELALESMVQTVPTATLPRTRLTTEQRAIIEMARAPVSVAELSAHLGLPLRTVLVVTGDLIGENLMTKAMEVNDMTIELLDQIRIALEAL